MCMCVCLYVCVYAWLCRCVCKCMCVRVCVCMCKSVFVIVFPRVTIHLLAKPRRLGIILGSTWISETHLTREFSCWTIFGLIALGRAVSSTYRVSRFGKPDWWAGSASHGEQWPAGDPLGSGPGPNRGVLALVQGLPGWPGYGPLWYIYSLFNHLNIYLLMNCKTWLLWIVTSGSLFGLPMIRDPGWIKWDPVACGSSRGSASLHLARLDSL